MPLNARYINQRDKFNSEEVIKQRHAAYGIGKEDTEGQAQSLRYALNRVMIQISRMILALLLLNCNYSG
jgi:hypothetical protein